MAMTSLASALLLTLAVGAVAIDNNWGGFVHFKNWKGCVPNCVKFKQPFQEAGFSLSILKGMCAVDSECKEISEALLSFGNFLDVGGATNTTYDMFLGIKGHADAAPAAFCTVESGSGNTPSVNWLACDNDFDFGLPDLGPTHILDTYNIPPEQMHTACLQNPKCQVRRLPSQKRYQRRRDPRQKWKRAGLVQDTDPVIAAPAPAAMSAPCLG
jgi:hypothetical protein